MENHGQKRSADDSNVLLEGTKAIVLDIEGTTTPISFVKEKLFPYVRDTVKAHLEGHFEDEECQEDINALRTQAAEDKATGAGEGIIDIPAKDANQEEIIEAAVKNVICQMDKDRKTTSLKQLQAHIWREAFKTGKIQGEVYEDVVTALKEWTSDEIKTYIYSSGSEEAQKLVFGYSDKGDLTEFISGYFDLNVGAKNDKASYSAIAEKISVDSQDILFLTDLAEEARAASLAGLRTCLIVREGNAPVTEEDLQQFIAAESFTEVCTMGQDNPPSKRLDGEEDEDDDDDLDGEEDLDEEDDLDGEDDLEGDGEAEGQDA